MLIVLAPRTNCHFRRFSRIELRIASWSKPEWCGKRASSKETTPTGMKREMLLNEVQFALPGPVSNSVVRSPCAS
jgi:hypothetical protein